MISKITSVELSADGRPIVRGITRCLADLEGDAGDAIQRAVDLEYRVTITPRVLAELAEHAYHHGKKDYRSGPLTLRVVDARPAEGDDNVYAVRVTTHDGEASWTLFDRSRTMRGLPGEPLKAVRGRWIRTYGPAEAFLELVAVRTPAAAAALVASHQISEGGN